MFHSWWEWALFNTNYELKFDCLMIMLMWCGKPWLGLILKTWWCAYYWFIVIFLYITIMYSHYFYIMYLIFLCFVVFVVLETWRWNLLLPNEVVLHCLLNVTLESFVVVCCDFFLFDFFFIFFVVEIFGCCLDV